MSHTEENRQRENIVTLSRSLYERGLSAGSSGNISVRLEDGWLMTPTNSCLGTLDPARISRLDREGRHISGDAPTKEIFLHRAMYDVRAKARAIVHLHSTCSVAVSCMAGLNKDDCIPPLTPYFVMKIGRLALIPYFRPGDPALGQAVSKLATRHSALLLANHGPVVSAASLEAAIYASEELEETAKLFLALYGLPTQPLNAEQITELKETFNLDL